MNRLRLVSRELLQQLTKASEELRRKVALVACEYAVTRTALRNPVIDGALEALRKRDLTDARRLRDLEAVRDRLDQEYADLYDRYGDTDQDRWLPTFCRMIAAESVCYACQEDSLTASSEAVFDALAVEKNLDGPHAKGVQDLVVNVLAAGPDQKMG